MRIEVRACYEFEYYSCTAELSSCLCEEEYVCIYSSDVEHKTI